MATKDSSEKEEEIVEGDTEPTYLTMETALDEQLTQEEHEEKARLIAQVDSSSSSSS